MVPIGEVKLPAFSADIRQGLSRSWHDSETEKESDYGGANAATDSCGSFSLRWLFTGVNFRCCNHTVEELVQKHSLLLHALFKWNRKIIHYFRRQSFPPGSRLCSAILIGLQMLGYHSVSLDCNEAMLLKVRFLSIEYKSRYVHNVPGFRGGV